MKRKKAPGCLAQIPIRWWPKYLLGTCDQYGEEQTWRWESAWKERFGEGPRAWRMTVWSYQESSCLAVWVCKDIWAVDRNSGCQDAASIRWQLSWGKNMEKRKFKNKSSGISLVVQWLRLWAPNAGGPGFNPWLGILDPTCHSWDPGQSNELIKKKKKEVPHPLSHKVACIQVMSPL